MIKYCPNCKSELSDNPKLAQLVKECKHCGGRYFQIETTVPVRVPEASKDNNN